MLRLELINSGRVLQVPEGTPLRDLLFQEGVEFPCGGHGRCSGCRVKVMEGELTPSSAEERLLDVEELRDGWRLACQAILQNDLKLEVGQWEAITLSDESAFEFRPGEGYGIAVDLGTTTVVTQLVDLSTGKVLAVISAWNAQAAHGADLMTRIEFAACGGRARLTEVAREQVGGMVVDLSKSSPGQVNRVLIVGNTAMHHLFAGLSVEPLAQEPFESNAPGLKQFNASELGWAMPEARVSVLPCLGGFVGSDLLAGIIATGLHKHEKPVALIDLGTNGEIVVGNKDRLLCASTAAGPAFEGARINMGMRAAKGAISSVTLNGGSLACEVIGGGPARGICGSGLVDAVATGLELGAIQPNGRLTGVSLQLSGEVRITQQDIRELQLAKGAIAAGLRIVAETWGVRCDQLDSIYLAGAFGNYVSLESARRIGLLPVLPARVLACGNTALRGAKMALFGQSLHLSEICSKIEHLPLNEHPDFQDLFIEHLAFPRVDSYVPHAA